VISSHPISYPKTERLDLLVALSQEACNNYYSQLKPGGVLLLDSFMVKQIPTSLYLGLPFTTLAAERIGNRLTLNSMVLGAVAHLLPFADARAMRKALEENLPPALLALNVKAFTLGQRLAKKHFGEAPEVWRAVEAVAEQSEENGSSFE